MVLVLANQVQLTRSQSKDQVNLLSYSFKKKAPNKGNPGQIIETVILTIEQVELFEEIS